MIDLAKIEREWLAQCGRCDAGLMEFPCTCPKGDYRNVMLELIERIRFLEAWQKAAVKMLEGKLDAAARKESESVASPGRTRL